MTLRSSLALACLAGALLLSAGLAACGGSGNGVVDPNVVPPGPVMDHTNIVLKDRWGNALTVSSREPYSPRETCGTCHDVDLIANGYHFQQGRTDATGAVQMRDDFFADGRDFLLSDGMYGKW